MANNAVTAKARAVYGKFLKKDDYISLTHKGTIAAAIAYLKTKPLYAGTFEDTAESTIHRKQAEELIHKNAFDNYMRVCRYVADGRTGIMDFHIKQLECEQLIKAIIAVNGGNQENFVLSYPEYISVHLDIDPFRLAASKNLPNVSEALKGTMYHKPLEPLLNEPNPDINRIVTMINVCYVKWAFEQIDKTKRGAEAEQLREFFLRKVDADNLLMCYRLRSTFGSNINITEMLIPYHNKLRPRDIKEALKAQDSVSALRDLFVKIRAAVPAYSDIPEISVNKADHKYFRHRLAVSDNEMESLYSLMMLFRTECTNLCRIIEGLRYGLPPEETEKYLIY